MSYSFIFWSNTAFPIRRIFTNFSYFSYSYFFLSLLVLIYKRTSFLYSKEFYLLSPYSSFYELFVNVLFLFSYASDLWVVLFLSCGASWLSFGNSSSSLSASGRKNSSSNLSKKVFGELGILFLSKKLF